MGHNLLLFFGCSGARTDIFLVWIPVIYLTACFFFHYLASLSSQLTFSPVLLVALLATRLLKSVAVIPLMMMWENITLWLGNYCMWIVEGKYYTCFVQSWPSAHTVLLFLQNFPLAVHAQSWKKKNLKKKKKRQSFPGFFPGEIALNLNGKVGGWETNSICGLIRCEGSSLLCCCGRPKPILVLLTVRISFCREAEKE